MKGMGQQRCIMMDNPAEETRDDRYSNIRDSTEIYNKKDDRGRDVE